jgi:hypothetical protein
MAQFNNFFNFGAGFVYANPLTTTGNTATNPSPQQMGTLQDASVEFNQTIKELMGNLKAPDDSATAELKITGKIKMGKVDFNIFNQVLFAETATPSTGSEPVVANEGPTAIPGTPFQVTVVNSANFATDLGVLFDSNKEQLVRVASSPTAGQYSVSAGVYTFAAADTTVKVDISYSWNDSTATTFNLIGLNHIMGYGPVCEIFFDMPYGGTNNALHLYAVRFGKLSLAMKNNDYTTPELDFTAYANAAGQIFKWSQTKQ